ncbi:zinc finger protein ZFAT-like [Maniola jurtina]|uniref:zinc finger protein ZFAT-like n=1 Tax=Maniola jurtina TaxID=191418 RepID=UPI001E686486|nr:zinc finger protein ZFAT-like [Maniola jurtina]
MKKHTKAFGTLECPVCKQYWGDKYALHKHSKSHATRYTCTLCGYTTMTNESARMHENWHKGTRYKCDHCDAEFIKYTSYMTHLRVKHPSDHICNQCGYSYLNELGLRSHLRRIHRLDKVEVRPCRYSTTTMPMYLRRQQVHVIHDALACEAPFRPHLQSVRLLLPERAGPPLALAQDSPLGQSRDSKYTSYMTHLRVKHPSDHICNQCGYSYLNELGLRSHLRRIHRLDKVETASTRHT